MKQWRIILDPMFWIILFEVCVILLALGVILEMIVGISQ